MGNMIFFKPNKRFIKWIKGAVGIRTVVDCGAGEGHLGAMLKALGITVLSLDLFEQCDAQSTVIAADTTEFKFPPRNCIAILVGYENIGV